MSWRDDWTEEQRAWLAQQFTASRERMYPKRTKFVAEVQASESTVQVLEGKRKTNIDDAMVEHLTAKVGWPSGYWRRVMTDRLPAPDSGPDLSSATSEALWAELRRRKEVGEE